MNYLLVGVIVLWCVSAYRRTRYSAKPSDTLPGSRTEAMRELLERAPEYPKHALPMTPLGDGYSILQDPKTKVVTQEILARASAKEPGAVEVLATVREEANGGV